MRFKQFNSSFYSILFLFAISCILGACNNNDQKKTVTVQESLNRTDTTPKSLVPEPPSFTEGSLSMKTFEVKDATTGRSKGWGYDIYIDGHKTIHQPILPGIPGNSSFSSEEKAKITGNYVLNRMMKSGTFVPVSEKELDSLGVIKK